MKKRVSFVFIIFSLLSFTLAFAQGEEYRPTMNIKTENDIARKCLGLQHWSMVKCVELERKNFHVKEIEMSDLKERGKTVYYQYCYVCHGLDGKGRGPAAEYSKSPVVDLTGAKVRKASDDELKERIIQGKSSMPGFTDYFFNKDDLLLVIKYIRVFPNED